MNQPSHQTDANEDLTEADANANEVKDDLAQVHDLVAKIRVYEEETRRLAPRRSRGLPRHGSAWPGCDRGGWRRVSRASGRV